MSRPHGERRAHPRFSIEVPLWLWRPGATEPERVRAVDASMGGLRIVLHDPPPVGTHLQISVHGPDEARPPGVDDDADDAILEVVRHEVRGSDSSVGARFLTLSRAMRDLLERLRVTRNVFGDYRIEALLGRGGMAEVYRAEIVRGARIFQKVALKRIRPDLLASPEVRRLFRQEGELCLALHHPNIVEVYEVGERDGITYFVMELVEGSDLERLLLACRARGIRLPVDFAAYVVHTVARALDYAHHVCGEDGRPLGIVHRDIGPSNLFISDTGEIKVGDFGVAHIGDLPREGERVVVGKPSYQAPEQVEGAPPHPAMDVFALGAVLYELLTGSRAFPMDADTASTQRRPPPRVRERRPEVSEDLAAVLERALALEVEGRQSRWRGWLGHPARYPSAGALADALEPCFDPKVGNQMAIAALVRGILGTAS